MPLNLKNSLAYFQKDAKSEERQQVIQCLNLFCKLKQEVTIKLGKKKFMLYKHMTILGYKMLPF